MIGDGEASPTDHESHLTHYIAGRVHISNKDDTDLNSAQLNTRVFSSILLSLKNWFYNLNIYVFKYHSHIID